MGSPAGARQPEGGSDVEGSPEEKSTGEDP